MIDPETGKLYYEDDQVKLPTPKPQLNDLIKVEKPHRVLGTHTITVPKDKIPKGYKPIKNNDEDLTITY